jgi:branched-chain amino acid aminotransferase
MEGRRLVDYRALSVWLDGVVTTEAEISVWDHGFLYGDGCFEGMRLREGSLFRPLDHFARLRRSARALALDLRHTDSELLQAIAAVSTVNALSDAHVRIIVTRGSGAPGLDPRRAEQPAVIVMAYPFPPLLGDAPIDLIVSSIVRKAPLSVDGHVKSLNYLDAVLAKLQANAAGAGDAIMLDATGTVSEATSTNVFVVLEGVVATPTTRSALPGITRKTAIELLRADGLTVVERDVTWGELYGADECFLTGSGAGIVSVASVDGRALPSAPGTVTERVRELYARIVRDPDYVIAVGDRPDAADHRPAA